MSHRKKNFVLLAVGLMTSIILLGIGCKKEKLDKDTEQSIKREVDQYLQQLLNERPLVGSTQSPIKVRGGAMTFRAQYWSTDTAPPKSPCIQGDPTYMELIDVVQLGTKPPFKADQAIFANLAPTWQMDLYGRDSTGKPQLIQGVRLTATATCGGKAGVDVAAETKMTMFYQTLDVGGNKPDDDGATFIHRYYYPTCVSDNNNTGDEDLCEHISAILINLTPTSTPKPASSTYKYLCVNGECQIGIGNPHPPN